MRYHYLAFTLLAIGGIAFACQAQTMRIELSSPNISVGGQIDVVVKADFGSNLAGAFEAVVNFSETLEVLDDPLPQQGGTVFTISAVPPIRKPGQIVFAAATTDAIGGGSGPQELGHFSLSASQPGPYIVSLEVSSTFALAYTDGSVLNFATLEDAEFNVTPLGDSDLDGISDTEEMALFGDLDETLETDFDGDGISNGTELSQGSNPAVWVGNVERSGSSAGVIDIADVTLLIQRIVNGQTGTLDFPSANVETSGSSASVVDIADVTRLIQYIVSGETDAL